MIILASGFVVFIGVISVLAFFFPEKTGPFLTLYAVPLAGLLGLGSLKAKDAWMAVLNKKGSK